MCTITCAIKTSLASSQIAVKQKPHSFRSYSLFIVSRYRSERKAGRPKLEAITVACNTTGRAVFYAGVTVLLSLAGLILTDSAIFVSMATQASSSWSP